MSNPVAVHWFTSAMSGAPALSGEAGKLIGVLDACLINGFGSVTLDGLVITDSVATATYSSGHGFLDHAVVLIEGATPAGANGEKRITRTSASVFTFDATGMSNQTATGTITAKMAPVGWEKRYSATDKGAYARTDLAATAMLLRVDDTPAQYPTLIMYESMSGIDSDLVGPAPTTGSLFFGKSSTANSTARAWSLYADDQALYLFGLPDSATWYGSMFFGDIRSFVSSDAFHCAIIGSSAANYTNANLGYINGTTTGSYLSRAYTQIGSALAMSRNAHQSSGTVVGAAGLTYPNPAGNLFLCTPVDVWEDSEAVCRGVMPGFYNSLHVYSAMTDGEIIANGPSGKKFRAQRTMGGGNNGVCGMDITGPWR